MYYTLLRLYKEGRLTDTKLHNVAKALYLYNKEADAYSAAN